jgi:hypothetical protein
MVHLRPAIGHTTGTQDAGEIRFYRGLRGVLLIGRVSAHGRRKCPLDVLDIRAFEAPPT